MKKSTGAALDDWLKEWEKVASAGKSADGHTTIELAEVVWGVSQEIAQHRVREMCRSGQAIHAGFRVSQSIIGRKCRTPVYRLKRGK